MGVRCEHRTATSRIGDDGNIAGIAKRGNVRSCKSACTFKIAGVRMQGATAYLFWRYSYCKTVSLEHSLGGSVDASKETFADTSCKQHQVLGGPIGFVNNSINLAPATTRALQ